MINPEDIFIALVDESEDYDPEIHSRHDLEVRNVFPDKGDELSFWSASVEIVNPGGGWFSPGRKTRAIISEYDAETDAYHHVITGNIEGWPVGKAGDILTLSIVAAAKQGTRQQLEDNALGAIDDDPWLLFTEGNGLRRTPEQRLASRYAGLNYGRKDTDGPVLVPYDTGSGFLDLGDNWIAETLTFPQAEQPITEVDVSLSAEWLQSAVAVLDVSDDFPNEGFFGTLNIGTNDFFNVGDTVGDWSVISSGVANEPAPGGDNWTPYYTVSSVDSPGYNPQDPSSTRSIRFPRYFRRLSLALVGVANARRRETVNFKVKWAGQRVTGYEGRTDRIELACSNLQNRFQPPEWQSGASYSNGAVVMADGIAWKCIAPHVSGGSLYVDFFNWDPLLINGADPLGGNGNGAFFGMPAQIGYSAPSGNLQVTTRSPIPGLSAIQYAFLQARSKILSSMRTIKASFDVPWYMVRELEGKERIRIAADPDLIPGGQMEGKVVSISADLIRGVASVTIAAIPGKDTVRGFPGQPNYAVASIGNVGVVQANINNAYQFQENMISGNIGSVEPDRIISEFPTSIDLVMSPVPKGGNLEVIIPMGTFFVDGPKMIDLEAVSE